MSRRREEDRLLADIRAAARLLGYLTYHTFDSRRSEPGLPDLVLVGKVVIWGELKSEKEGPTADQEAWIQALRRAGQVVYLWRPSDWEEIKRVLLEHRP